MRRMVALLLMAFWPVVSSHPLLQHYGLIHQFHANLPCDPDGSNPDGSNAPHEHHVADHEAADGHCLLSSKEVSVPAPQMVMTPLWICLLAFEWTPGLSSERPSPGLAPPGSAPPGLSHRWQFSLRAALPVRAPSFASFAS